MKFDAKEKLDGREQPSTASAKRRESCRNGEHHQIEEAKNREAHQYVFSWVKRIRVLSCFKSGRTVLIDIKIRTPADFRGRRHSHYETHKRLV